MVTKIENFFSEELYNELLQWAYDVVKSPEAVFTSNRFWLEYIIATQPVLIYRISQNPELYEKVERELAARGYTIQGAGHLKNLFIYYWPQYSFIPWHFDGPDRNALTVYMNPEWDSNNGGFFCYEDGDEIKTIIPKRNFGIINDRNVNHCTTAVNSQIFRLSVQAFLDKV